ncbi:MAG: glycosyltransferase [Candidatus Dormiibacterota bacterium]
MRICILTVGTRGDVQPYIALGTALRSAGHAVKLATVKRYEALVRAYGLDFGLLEDSPISFVERVVVSRGNPISRALETRRVISSMMARLLDDALRLAQSADAIITSNLLIYPGYQITQEIGIPSIGTFLVPYMRTRAFPNPAFFSGRRSLSERGNLLTYDLFNEALWQFYRGGMNRQRKGFGLSALPRFGMADRMQRDHYPFLCAYSPSVVPRPGDWAKDIQVTGYWFLDATSDWEPAAELQTFLDAGPAPVYVGFGSMNVRDPVAMARLIVEALRQTGQRGILQSDSPDISQMELPKEVFVLSDAPHDWLFPKMAALVHHGGAGTTAASLRAGVPTIVVPTYGDQFFWGQRISALGVGPDPIPRKRLTAERLAAALRIATHDHEMQQRAMAVARLVRAEDGPKRAVELLETFSPRVSQGSGMLTV